MKVDIKGDRYIFKTENDKQILSFYYDQFPSCCLMGIIHRFERFDITKNYYKEIEKYLVEELIPDHEINQILFTDTELGFGFGLFENMQNCSIINMAFNQNSGNYVYTFCLYSER